MEKSVVGLANSVSGLTKCGLVNRVWVGWNSVNRLTKGEWG